MADDPEAGRRDQCDAAVALVSHVPQVAASLVAAMCRGKLAATELMNACYDQIERLNPQLNAIVRRRDASARAPRRANRD